MSAADSTVTPAPAADHTEDDDSTEQAAEFDRIVSALKRTIQRATEAANLAAVHAGAADEQLRDLPECPEVADLRTAIQLARDTARNAAEYSEAAIEQLDELADA